ncbi:MAG: Fic family protein, partial [Trebonia sp.]
VWIGGSSVSPHGASFVAPHHSWVEPAIDDLVAFIQRTDLPLLTQVAIAHAQFETIHPFNDGNGRTGRALCHAMLRHGGATTRTTVPVSAGLLADTDAYFTALTGYRAGDPSPIAGRFGEAAKRRSPRSETGGPSSRTSPTSTAGGPARLPPARPPPYGKSSRCYSASRPSPLRWSSRRPGCRSPPPTTSCANCATPAS